MKEIRQAIACFLAMMILGVFIAFLLYKIQGVQSFEQGNVESVLPAKIEETIKIPSIRVLIKTTGFHEIAHEKVEVSAENGLVIVDGNKVNEFDGDEKVILNPNTSSVRVKPKALGDKIKIHSIERGYGTPEYGGGLEVYETEEGLIIVNEISMEEYLRGVVPSEMPASYEKEALKAQAICARCYAYNQSKEMSYPEYGAHVDDSVSFQVYNNSEEQDVTNEAVQETLGELLWYEEEVAMTYFYSTSSGNSTSIEAWGTQLIDSNQYLKGVSISDEEGLDYEKELSWYKWIADISVDVMEKIVKSNLEKDIGNLCDIEITKIGQGGVVQEIEIIGTKSRVCIESENKIRKVLGGEGYQITKKDGTIINSTKMLPSAFFSLEKNEDSYIISGGGYGHGIGMSQNGANELAKAGKDYKEILEFFYPGTKVK